MKKYIFTESQLKKVLDNQLNEQTAERDAKKAIQCFLNKVLKPSPNLTVDGLHGDATSDAIARFQNTKRHIDNDGVWGYSTAESMTPQEKVIFRKCVSDTGDLGDKIFHFLGIDKLFS
jgi:hypothetical protein